jgi:PAS domain S-box-containing protein
MTYLAELGRSAPVEREELDDLREQVHSLRHASARLERERSKYIDLFQHAPDAYLVTDAAGTIADANVAAGALFRAAPSSLVGRSFTAFVTQQDAATFGAFLQSLTGPDAAGSGRAARIVLRMRPRGHSVFVVFARVTAAAGEGAPVTLRWTLRCFNGEAG